MTMLNYFLKPARRNELQRDFFDEFLDDDDDLKDPNENENRKKSLKKEFYVKRSRLKRRTQKISGIEEK